MMRQRGGLWGSVMRKDLHFEKQHDCGGIADVDFSITVFG